ncbi:PAS domain S-box [Archaeoglobus sulfaticallidus PM70-1]|uniref:histidine kinase n=1 Tax=Archaeoglobus sulfaticallidus PM70-1 TaxID=387631 RepID=N0BFR8_9EURY|nr:PAS domain S-box [Archaeoglobus sulfaticallidus PM70-1]
MDWKKMLDESLAGIFVIVGDRYKYVNKVFEDATGYSLEEIYDIIPFYKIAYEEDIPTIKKAIRSVLSGNKEYLEVRYVTKKGKIRYIRGFFKPFEVDGEKAILGSLVDVTKNKEFERKLKITEKLFRKMVDESQTPAYIVQNEKFIYVNDAFAETVGYSKGELYEINPFMLVHPDHREMVYRRYKERISGERETDTYKWKIVTKSGEIRWVVARPSRTVINDEPAVCATLVDITEIEKLNEELRRKNRYLTLINKIMRHDMLNDLAVIRGFVELIDVDFAEKIISRVDKTVRMINILKELERSWDSLHYINLKERIEHVIKDYDGVDFELDIDNVDVRVNDGIDIVFRNLIDNALKHSGAEKLKVKIKAYKEKDKVIVEFSDNGKGIDEKIKERLFEDGFTTNGQGMGLYIVKEILISYGGSIEIIKCRPLTYRMILPA